VRIICLIVLLSFGDSLYAESIENEKDEKQNVESITPESIEKNNEVIISAKEGNSRSDFPLTKKSTFLPESKKTTSSSSPSVSTLSNWPVVLIMLFGIVCLILGLAWFVKRFGGFNMTGGRDMRVLSTVPLGARERVALIDVKGQQFLIGVTTQNINHLHTFDEPVVDTTISNTNKLNVNGFPKSDFAKKLQQLLTTTKSSSDERV
jgi:flagellar biosynthetic protein FliO